MVGVEEKGRQLPGWMLGVSASAQVEKSDNVKSKKKPVEEGLSSEAAIPGPRSKKRSLREKENLSENEGVLAKCTKRQRKVKESQVVADSDIDISVADDVLEEMCGIIGREVSKAVSRRRRKTKGYRSSFEELDIQPPSEDEDVDLTVEDLMTIAKEYVGDGQNMEQDQASNRKREQRRKSPTTMSERSELICHDNARICDETKTIHEINASCLGETKSAHDVSSYNKLESSSTEEIFVNINRTGDPAQDMLDLFLGPLLKKPVAERQKDFLTADVDFSQQLEVQSKTSLGRGEIGPSIKKKSSLKDKVSFFLD